MTPRLPLSADTKAEIIRLRGERLTYREIGAMVGVHEHTAALVCRNHFDSAVARAAAELRREVLLARSEMHSAPLFHPETWG